MDRLAAEKQLNAVKRHWFQKRKNLWTTALRVEAWLATQRRERPRRFEITTRNHYLKATRQLVNPVRKQIGLATEKRPLDGLATARKVMQPPPSAGVARGLTLVVLSEADGDRTRNLRIDSPVL